MRVATAAALLAAVQQGTRHIAVTAHLDLSSLPLVDEGFLLGIIRDSTRSIVVRSPLLLSLWLQWAEAGHATVSSESTSKSSWH